MPSIKVRKIGDLVYVVYTHNGKIFKVYTGIKVEDKFWNLCAISKTYPDFDNARTRIAEMQMRVMNAAIKVRAQGHDPSVGRVQAEFHAQDGELLTKRSFWENYDDFLRVKKYKTNSKNKIELYKRTLDLYCAWSGYEMDMVTWGRLNFGRFIQYLLFKQNLDDYDIQKLVRWLKVYMKFAYPLKNLSWMKYDINSSEEEIVALTGGELQNLIDADLGGYLETARDLFVFLATTGMRFCDSQVSNPSLVTENDMIKFAQHKTVGGSFPPLYGVSMRVLAKYGGAPPQVSEQRLEESLKELCAELKLNRPITLQTTKGNSVISTIFPLSEVINSDTARKTFISLCLLKGASLQDIMIFTRHSDYKSMRPYLKYHLQHLKNVADKGAI
jgi:hypothetical protein